jgi:hypothetical protein
LENQFTPHDVNDERRVEARFQSLLGTVDNNPSERVRPGDTQKLIKSLKMRRPAELMAFQTNAAGTFQEDHWYISLK